MVVEQMTKGYMYIVPRKRVTQVDRVVKKPIGLFAIISHVTTVHKVGDITPGAKKLSKTVSINMKKGPKSKRHLSIPSPATAWPVSSSTLCKWLDKKTHEQNELFHHFVWFHWHKLEGFIKSNSATSYWTVPVKTLNIIKTHSVT